LIAHLPLLNIVIPIVGLGSRFAKAGFKDPKPLISVHGVPMIRLIIENIRPSFPTRFISICQRSHATSFDLEENLAYWAPGCEVLQIDGLTEGAACTVLTARALIDDDVPLMIANMTQRNLDGLIMTMRVEDPKWSYVEMNDAGHAMRVVEKEVISEHATVGIYNFRRGRDFVRAADRMIAREEKVNGEFYVAPVYNQLIVDGAKIGISSVGTDGHGMHGLGIPSDLEAFLSLPLSRRATDGLA
jgi:dTDP-glucose pyrophosphorylase